MGNMEFVGHLFKVGMATANMVHTCMQDLLQDPTSEELECACKLFSTAGPHLQVLFSSSYCAPSCSSCSILGSQSNCFSMLVGHVTRSQQTEAGHAVPGRGLSISDAT
jgi:hypothetical protein